MDRTARILVQVVAYTAFAAFTGYLSASPAYHYAAAGNATVKLSLSHAAERVKPCVRLTPEEIAALAPNMRRPEKCERERLPLTVELDIDGETVARVIALPSGLWNDGPASVYERFEVAPGPHRVVVKLRDSSRADGWDYTHAEDVTLPAGGLQAVRG